MNNKRCLKIFLILALLTVTKTSKVFALDPSSIFKFFTPFIGADLVSDKRTYTEKYGDYSKYWAPLDHLEVGTCMRYYSNDKDGIACKQGDGSWKIKK